MFSQATLQRVLPIWWSMYWRGTIAGAVAGAIAGGLLGFATALAGRNIIPPMMLPIVVWLVTVPVGMWALAVALKKHRVQFQAPAAPQL